MTANRAPKIRVRDLRKDFPARDAKGRVTGAFTAIDGVSLDIAEGEFVAVVGPSGCGKSTLLDLLGGLSAPTAGAILLDGEPIRGTSLDRGVVFQQYALFPWLTALENVAFSLQGKISSKDERRDVARKHLALVGLQEFGERYPHQLSGGMKQRVALARSLAHDPSILLMDEPFAALDAQTRELLQAELLRIWEQSRKTIVFITHGIDEAIYLGQKIAIMTSRPGRIKQILINPLAGRTQVDDIRGSPEFARLRHEVWSLLRDEINQAAALELAAT
ncbi:ABC transporter ATP-binding protein [Methylosinus sp. H3A]|uniref:ABC transporter ATP-binding protein n=1 Tax=Methylosinus sp. H3A TaxID=2785786 RepID=UPI0018C23AD1|nr:ABC transporter ATP-binding protein [Methylosinus sp. H3A]MBG0808281.1 ABC transporter ATP-binding protein [Methylosinus sp. H3A]